jgi:hypothetical protein
VAAGVEGGDSTPPSTVADTGGGLCSRPGRLHPPDQVRTGHTERPRDRRHFSPPRPEATATAVATFFARVLQALLEDLVFFGLLAEQPSQLADLGPGGFHLGSRHQFLVRLEPSHRPRLTQLAPSERHARRDTVFAGHGRDALARLVRSSSGLMRSSTLYRRRLDRPSRFFPSCVIGLPRLWSRSVRSQQGAKPHRTNETRRRADRLCDPSLLARGCRRSSYPTACRTRRNRSISGAAGLPSTRAGVSICRILPLSKYARRSHTVAANSMW